MGVAFMTHRREHCDDYAVGSSSPTQSATATGPAGRLPRPDPAAAATLGQLSYESVLRIGADALMLDGTFGVDRAPLLGILGLRDRGAFSTWRLQLTSQTRLKGPYQQSHMLWHD